MLFGGGENYPTASAGHQSLCAAPYAQYLSELEEIDEHGGVAPWVCDESHARLWPHG